jgi:hypothetical protein
MYTCEKKREDICTNIPYSTEISSYWHCFGRKYTLLFIYEFNRNGKQSYSIVCICSFTKKGKNYIS